ncbi:hypothetical protein BD410DRAFT_805447 [Rickenella mellea]|uniref:Uncharacterized protein n=1 Tax=Rickenella mellea TaxID=50990 RepID=A0A4Y7PY04_9AGAM|nr:hypothetical protein BD410DRAFT_805447 [Rickenella mellea]
MMTKNHSNDVRHVEKCADWGRRGGNRTDRHLFSLVFAKNQVRTRFEREPNVNRPEPRFIQPVINLTRTSTSASVASTTTSIVDDMPEYGEHPHVLQVIRMERTPGKDEAKDYAKGCILGVCCNDPFGWKLLQTHPRMQMGRALPLGLRHLYVCADTLSLWRLGQRSLVLIQRMTAAKREIAGGDTFAPGSEILMCYGNSYDSLNIGLSLESDLRSTENEDYKCQLQPLSERNLFAARGLDTLLPVSSNVALFSSSWTFWRRIVDTRDVVLDQFYGSGYGSYGTGYGTGHGTGYGTIMAAWYGMAGMARRFAVSPSPPSTQLDFSQPIALAGVALFMGEAMW